MRNLVRLLVIAGLIASVVPGVAYGQSQTGNVTGTVVDPTDAVIPGAKVVLKNDATGVTRETTTNESGYFNFDKIAPGIYSVTIAMANFKKVVVSGLDVRVAKSTDLGSTKLEVGPVDSAIQVEAGSAALVETQSAQITSSLSTKQVTELRQGFGGLDGLAILTPGVIPGIGNVNSNGMQVAANGQRSRSTQFMLDGHQMNDITIGGPSFFFNNLDQVAEYQVITNQFSAENGRNLGATVNIITKGGTNDYHGTVYWLHRNSAMDSKTSLQSQNNIKKPNLINNQGGVTVRGPILRNKLFFLGSFRYEKQPGSTTSIGTSSAKVFTTNGINTLLAAFPTSNTVAVYKTAGPFAMPIGNPTCVASTLATITVGAATGVEVCGVQRNVPSQSVSKDYSARIDYETGKHTLTGRWMWSKNDFCCSGGQSGYFIAIPDKEQTIGITYLYRVSSNVVNSFKFSWGRFLVAFEGANTQPISNVRANLARIDLPSGFLDFGLATNLPQNRLLNTFQYSDAISYSKGKHFMRAGLEFHRNLTTLFFLPFINGQFSYSNIANWANNAPSTVTFAAGNGTFDPGEFDQFYFFQDDIKLTPSLTVNLGVRYEHNGQPINRAVDEILNRETNPATAFWLRTVPIGERTLPRIPNDDNNWAPRIGFAWSPPWKNWLLGDKQTVIRGGYGIAYELAFYNILLNMTTASPRVFLFSLTSAAGTAIPLPGNGLGSDVASVIPVPLNSIDPRTLSQTRLSPNFHNPYGQNWSLGIQREIGRSQVLEVRYVGTNGIGLFQSRNANPLFSVQNTSFPSTVTPSPLFPSGTVPCPAAPVTVPPTPNPTGVGRVDCNRRAVRERINSARSNYNSLQVRYDMRNFKGQLTAGAAYTYSKGIDNVSEIFAIFGSGSVAFAENPFNINKSERGASNQNLAQTLALSYIWDLPWFRSQKGVVGRVLGGWSVSGVSTFLSGRPWTPVQFTGNTVCGQDGAFNSAFAGILATCRAFLATASAPLTEVGFVDSTGQIHQNSSSGTVVPISAVHFLFNDANAVTFFHPTNPFGVGRNNFRGNRTFNSDIAINKKTNITERISLRYRMAMNNAFNHRNFGVPDIFVDDPGTFAVPQKNDVGGRSIRMGFWVEF